MHSQSYKKTLHERSITQRLQTDSGLSHPTGVVNLNIVKYHIAFKYVLDYKHLKMQSKRKSIEK